MTDPRYTFRARNADGTWHETDGLTAEQAAKLGNGHAISYTVTNERILVDDNGRIIQRETAGEQRELRRLWP